jgi:hypothetical protein
MKRIQMKHWDYFWDSPRLSGFAEGIMDRSPENWRAHLQVYRLADAIETFVVSRSATHEAPTK